MNPATDTLAPLRAALLDRARAEAERIRVEATATAGRRLAAARAEADAIRAEADRTGRAQARAAGVAEVAAAGRDARRLVLRGRRDAYFSLRDAIRDRLANDPRLPAVFAARLRRILSPDAILGSVPGGVAGVRGTQRAECTVNGLADEALRRLGTTAEELWSP